MSDDGGGGVEFSFSVRCDVGEVGKSDITVVSDKNEQHLV